MSYPIDIEAAKNTKLFKKFMQSKNKSVSISAPRMENIQISVKSPTRLQPNSNIMNQFENVGKRYQQQQNRFTNYSIQRNPGKIQQTVRRNIDGSSSKQMENRFQYQSNQNRQVYGQSQLQRNTNKENTEGKKYDCLLEQYNELRDKVTNQRKQAKKQLIKLQQQIDMLNKKIFEFRNREDELILQNKRLKEKNSSQVKQKQKIEEANRELSYQVQQLKDMLDGQESSNKKKEDEASHWKKINEDLRQRNRQLEMEITKLKDLNNMFEREKFVFDKEVSNKQSHLNEMRQRINNLINQNGVLRDQIYHITSKLYHLEQQNKSMKADLRRHSEDFPMSYLQEQLQDIRRSQPVEHQHTIQKNRVEQTEAVQNQKRTERRRGQFARERAIKKIENIGNEIKGTAQNSSQIQNMTLVQKTGTRGPTVNNINNKEVSSAVRKLQQLNQQLQKLKDMKAMNGAMRRNKINIQREILQLQQFLKSNS